MLDKMGGGLPEMAALLFCKEIKKRAASELLLFFYLNILIFIIVAKNKKF